MPDIQRYKVALSYRGTNFSGWQRQPNAESVQAVVEQSLSLLTRENIRLVGCGRTDAGVHAKNYIAHFDLQESVPPEPDVWQYKLNRMLPESIVIHYIEQTSIDFHARFSAKARTYQYWVSGEKDPFQLQQVYRFPMFHQMETKHLQSTADLIQAYNEFFPFCKAHSDTPHYLCDIHHANWTKIDDKWKFEIKANRFLRGMVRLIVGACLQVATGKAELYSIRQALDTQSHLPKPLSAPAAGLYLVAVDY